MTEPAVPSPAGPHDAIAHRIRERIRYELVAALSDIRELALREARALLMDLVCEATGRRAALREHSTMQLQFLELFRFCAGQPGGLSALSRCVGAISAESPETVVIQRLADEWTALDALPDLIGSWELLRRELGTLELPVAHRTVLIRDATGNRVVELLAHCETPWDDFLYLVGQNAAPHSLPPWIYYLIRCEDGMSPKGGREIMARSRKWAVKFDLAPLVDRLRYGVDVPPSVSRRRQEVLTISIAPDPLNRDLYSVSHAFMPDTDVHAWKRGQVKTPVARPDLEPVVSGVIRRIERAGGDRNADLWLEFVLPFELLNLPVDWWARDDTEGSPTPLIVNYPVFLRSLERLRHGEWHRQWRKRWEQYRLDEPAATSVFVNTRQLDGRHLQGLEARLAGNEHYVALVLSQPPSRDDEGGEREISAALRSGLPIIIWHRDPDRTREFHRVVRTLLSEGLRHFPLRVASYRREAAQLDAAQQPTHLGRHLAVLWDDPDRNPLAPHQR